MEGESNMRGNRSNARSLALPLGLLATAILMTAICVTAHAAAMLPPMAEEAALHNADLYARARVISVEPKPDGGELKEHASLVSIQILTKGVSAKEHATVFWSQTLADASITRPDPPQVGQAYRVYLRRSHRGSDFEPVHPDWAFVPLKTPEEESLPQYLEHTVSRGDTLYALARYYYGKGQRWHVLKVANFEEDAEGEVYPLKPGTKIRVPAFPMEKAKRKSNTQP